MEELESKAGAWELKKNKERTAPRKNWNRGSTKPNKRAVGSRETRPQKKKKFDLIPRGWRSLTMEESRAKTTCEGAENKEGGAKEEEDIEIGRPPPSIEERGGVVWR